MLLESHLVKLKATIIAFGDKRLEERFALKRADGKASAESIINLYQYFRFA
jgi:hypothetical protein